MPFFKKHALRVRARSLRLRDVATLAQIFGVLGRLLVLQRIMPLPSLLRRFDTRPQIRPVSRAHAERVINITNALLQHLYGQGYCFQRSIVLFYFLRRWGYPARIRFGITKKDDKLTGHAWLDLHGTPFREYADPHSVYQTIYTYPPAPVAPAGCETSQT